MYKFKRWLTDKYYSRNIDAPDYDYWCNRMAQAYAEGEESALITILDDWAEENRKSCERGTKIHAKLENQFYKEGKNVTLNKFGIGGKFECRKDYSDLDLEYGVYPEYLIYYDNPKLDLHIAGQIDLLVKNNNDIHIIDHKSNKKIDLAISYYDKIDEFLKQKVDEKANFDDSINNLIKMFEQNKVYEVRKYG